MVSILFTLLVFYLVTVDNSHDGVIRSRTPMAVVDHSHSNRAVAISMHIGRIRLRRVTGLSQGGAICKARANDAAY